MVVKVGKECVVCKEMHEHKRGKNVLKINGKNKDKYIKLNDILFWIFSFM